MPDFRFVYHSESRKYDFGPSHPFSPRRQELVLDLLDALDALPDAAEPAVASRDEILSVHEEDFVRQVIAASRGRPGPDAGRYGIGTMDVPAFAGMDHAARILVGGTLMAARMAAPGRPALHLGGGLHHAMRDRASGFCVYNDVAIAILDLVRRGLRVAYVDIDAHHGDGVQSIFYDDERVLTLSLHETGRYIFPGTGFVDEIGEGQGRGCSLNVPLAPRTNHDSYLEVFDLVVPAALEQFGADALIVECGADAHARDPLAHLRLDTGTFIELFDRLFSLAEAHCGNRLVLHLGGGYDLNATVRIWTILALRLQGLPLPERLPATWVSRWENALETDLSSSLHDAMRSASVGAASRQNRQEAHRLLDLVSPYW